MGWCRALPVDQSLGRLRLSTVPVKCARVHACSGPICREQHLLTHASSLRHTLRSHAEGSTRAHTHIHRQAPRRAGRATIQFFSLPPAVYAHAQLVDSIFDQKFMVTTRHRQRMAQPLQLDGGGAAACRAIQPWHFEQFQDEAVFIPAGCPHQVGGQTGWGVFCSEVGGQTRLGVFCSEVGGGHNCPGRPLWSRGSKLSGSGDSAGSDSGGAGAGSDSGGAGAGVADGPRLFHSRCCVPARCVHTCWLHMPSSLNIYWYKFNELAYLNVGNIPPIFPPSSRTNIKCSVRTMSFS